MRDGNEELREPAKFAIVVRLTRPRRYPAQFFILNPVWGPLVMLRILLLLLLSTTALAQQSLPRTMYVTFNDAPLYDSASYMSTILTRIAIGDSVTMTGRQGAFAHVLYHDRAGYLLLSNLGTLPPRRIRHDAASRTGRDTVRTESADTSDRAARPAARAPAGTASRVQCRAVTRSGTQCTRMTSDPSGYCWQHRKE